MGHARALLGCDDHNDLLSLADRIIKDQLNVRQTESLLRNPGQKKRKQPASPSKKSAAVTQLEDRLRITLGSQVRIKTHKDGGKIEIDYYSLEDLDRLIDLLTAIEKNIDFQYKNQ